MTMRLLWASVLGAGLFFTAASTAPARTFFVDATRGHDDRNGLSEDNAWQSLAQVSRATLAPADQVLFRRGQTWRGQLRPHSGSTNGVITYGAFGSGPKPVFLGSAAMDHTGDWQAAGAGLWITTPLRFDSTGETVDLPADRWGVYHEGGADCSLAVGDSSQDQGKILRLEGRKPGSSANHIQLSIGGLSVKAGDYYLLRFEARATRPFVPASFSLMKNGPPWTAYAGSFSTNTTIGTHWTERSVRFHGSESASDARLTLFLGGTLPGDCTLFLRSMRLEKVLCSQERPLDVDVGNIIFDQGARTGVKKWREADLREPGDFYYDARTWQVTLRSDTNPATQHQSIELALCRHIIDQGNCGFVAYENLDLRYGAAHGIGGGSTRHITVRNCDISYIGGGHQNAGSDGAPVRYGNGIEFWAAASDSLVEGCRIWEVYDAALTNQGSGTNVEKNIIYRRNVIWNSEYSFEYWNRGAASVTRNIVFENNICVDAGYGWGHRQRPDPNGRHLMFYDNTAATTNVVIRHNIFVNSVDSLMRLHGRDWTAALTLDENCWHQEGKPCVLRSDKPERLGGSLALPEEKPYVLWGDKKIGESEFKAFMQARGLEAHAVVADPKFIDAAHRDFRLTPGSPVAAWFAQ
jgi:hypothetical protein